MSKNLRDIAYQSYFPVRLTITSNETIKQYEYAFKFLDRYLKRPATTKDLNDETISGFTRWLHIDRKLAAKTANERSGRIITLWEFLARKRVVSHFPSVQRIREPRKTPKSWTVEEIAKLFAATERFRGVICNNYAPDWWRALFALAWNTGERISALLSIEWSDLHGNTLTVRAECRKAKRSDETYILWDETLALVYKLSQANTRILEYHASISALYHRMAKALRWAGLRADRQSKFHCFRVSHATWTQALGGDATLALRHSSPATTQKHYIDPRIAKIPASQIPHEFLANAGQWPKK